MRATQRTALREAGFTKAQTNALALALEPLATKEDLRLLATKEDLLLTKGDLKSALEALRKDLEALRIDQRWMKWAGGAIGLAVLAELVSGFS